MSSARQSCCRFLRISTFLRRKKLLTIMLIKLTVFLLTVISVSEEAAAWETLSVWR